MKKPGPPPKPTHLKIVTGNPGKRALPKNEPQPDIRAPARPRFLVGEAAREWERVMPQLVQLRLMSDLDCAAFAAYCQNWARYLEAERALKKHGAVLVTDKGYPVMHPWVSISNQAQANMAKFLTEFGMTPASRSRVSAAPHSTNATGAKEKTFQF